MKWREFPSLVKGGVLGFLISIISFIIIIFTQFPPIEDYTIKFYNIVNYIDFVQLIFCQGFCKHEASYNQIISIPLSFIIYGMILGFIIGIFKTKNHNKQTEVKLASPNNQKILGIIGLVVDSLLILHIIIFKFFPYSVHGNTHNIFSVVLLLVISLSYLFIKNLLYFISKLGWIYISIWGGISVLSFIYPSLLNNLLTSIIIIFTYFIAIFIILSLAVKNKSQ